MVPLAWPWAIIFFLPDITGCTALAVRPDVVNTKYHVITNATYNRDPVPAKFKHVTNIETRTLLCCDYSTLWEALHVNMVEIGARCSDKNVKILGRYYRNIVDQMTQHDDRVIFGYV